VRVIAGSAKGHRLQSVPGEGTRPITDRVKEALFSILGTDIIGVRVLDLFAGTGAVGIEALSRGAAHAIFVDKAPAALKAIRANLEHTRLAEWATVVRSDAFKYLSQPHTETFGLIYIAPPQYEGLWLKALQRVDSCPELLDSGEAGDGIVVVQIHPKEYEVPELQNLEEYDQRQYGSTLLSFYELRLP
jgi:16S rRNA (guanine966-N2)-methyltransferase